VLAALRSTDPAARIEALIALESCATPIDVQICRELIVLLGDERKEIRRRASGALARAVPEPQCRGLIDRALCDQDARRRWCACFALAHAGILDAPVVEAAIEALGFEDGDVRWAAAQVVCRAVRVCPDVLEHVRSAARAAVAERRKMALYCLRDLGVADEAAFLAALEDPDRGVRMAALAALGRGALSPQAVDRMMSIAQRDEDGGVRRAAAAVLGRLLTVVPDRDEGK